MTKDLQPGPSTSMIPAKPSLRIALALLAFAILFLLAWPHHPEGGWNVNTRLALVFSVVDAQTLQIDSYHDTPPYSTGDKALYDGHYYSDKIFGVSVLAIPFYAVGQLLTGSGLGYHGGYYLSKFGAVAIPGAIAAWLYALILIRLGTPPRRAVLLTFFTVVGTMWLGFGTIFYPYMPAFAAMLGALYMILFPPQRRMTLGNCLLIGFLMGFALICETTVGLAIFGLGVIWLLRCLDQGGFLGQRAFAEMAGERSTFRQLIPLATLFWVGVLIPVFCFAAYTYAIFGEVAMPYKFEANQMFAEGMSQGLFGISTFNIKVLYYITLHPYRGFFFWSPIMGAGLIGCIIGTRQYGKRMLLGWMGIYTLLGYLLFNLSYYMWWGGWTMGARFLIPVIPFLGFGLSELARSDKLSFFANRKAMGLWVWRGTMALGIVSVLLCAPLSLTDPQVPQGATPQDQLFAATFEEGNPQVLHFRFLKAFYRGDVTLWPTTRLEGYIGTENRGMNLLSILVYLAVAGVLLVFAYRFMPEKIAGQDRNDYPLKTIDGAAAPPPPGLFR